MDKILKPAFESREFDFIVSDRSFITGLAYLELHKQLGKIPDAYFSNLVNGIMSSQLYHISDVVFVERDMDKTISELGNRGFADRYDSMPNSHKKLLLEAYKNVYALISDMSKRMVLIGNVHLVNASGTEQETFEEVKNALCI